MRSPRYALFVLAVVAFGATHAASDEERPYWRTNLFKRVITDQKFLVTKWWPQEIKDPLFAGTLGAGVALAIESGSRDNRGQDFDWEIEIAGGTSPGVQHASHVFTRIGNGAPIALVLGITYFSARHAHDDRLAEASSLAGEALLDAGLWIEVLKAASARVRPSNVGAGEFFQYGAKGNGSFPSGHAMGSFAVAAAFAGAYEDKKWVPWLSFGLASLVSASRLALGRHFPADVVVGAVLGTSIGHGVVARSREESPSHRFKGSIGPVSGPEGRGVGLAWSYSW